MSGNKTRFHSSHQRMKTKFSILFLFLTAGICGAQTNFSITTPGNVFQFSLDGTTNGAPAGQGEFINNSPPLTLAAGATYTFSISTTPGFHPVEINTTNSNATNFQFSGASPQAITTGDITLTIPSTDFPTNLFYICALHGFYGVITVVPPTAPTAPPPNTIISIALTSTNVTVTSTGTDTPYLLVPQFNSNLVSGVWLDVPAGFNPTNTFANGTNVTVFDRLEPICGPNVFIRISQQPPQ